MRSRPSPAIVIAILALVAALGGTAIAGSKINGKKLKKESVAGNRLKDDTVTGTQINESTLGAVPNATNATHATSADTATNADAVDGQSAAKVFFATDGVVTTDIFTGSGLTVKASCSAIDDISLSVNTSKNDAEFDSWNTSDSGAANTIQSNGDDNFDIADSPEALTWDDSRQGQIFYGAPDGATAVVHMNAEEDSLGTPTKDCVAFGQAQFG